jgi:hypothetical protein
VYQIDPSGATAGSCGYGGLLGVSHSSILTSTPSGMADALASATTARAASTMSEVFLPIIVSSPRAEDQA